MEKQLDVFLEKSLVGSLYISSNASGEIFSFAYSKDYLTKKHAINIDPFLMLVEGRQYPSNGTFGFINDINPDRWGRNLIDKYEIELANQENRIPIKLKESDYLLRLSDYLRCGAIRLFDVDKKVFLSSDNKSAPTLTNLDELSETIRKYENAKGKIDLASLLSPGSSLGGSRPKANIEIDDELYIAKFPSKNDEFDIGAWEMVVYRLAILCGINMSKSFCVKSRYGHIFITKRFDRNKDERLMFSSMMTLLNATDGTSNQYSYLDLGEIITKYSSTPNEDNKELFRRLVFDYLINNTDNHLRNHALILSVKEAKWKLSPAFDLNINPYMTSYALNIDKNTEMNIKNLIEYSIYFGYTCDEAIKIYNNMSKIIVQNFASIAKDYEIKEKEIKIFKALIERKNIDLLHY